MPKPPQIGVPYHTFKTALDFVFAYVDDIAVASVNMEQH